ncbi:MAG: YraN family protein [Bacteroidetes bacterium GWA2_30_7]|nr:MAG: YraN family protein [Bacteroidetes bacterium GWA2_30_7]
MTNNIKIGDEGEILAVAYLLKKGYKILEKKWRFAHKEIDIISKIDNIIVIVEVKTRKKNSIINPAEAVTIKKQKHLIAAAQAYIEQNNLNNNIRFDIISIVYSGNKADIEHIEDAFYPYLL